jgi:hypothetical protein
MGQLEHAGRRVSWLLFACGETDQSLEEPGVKYEQMTMDTGSLNINN